MQNTYRDILENNKDWEDQIPLLETLRDITNDEIKNIRKDFWKIQQEQNKIQQEYDELIQIKEKIITEENQLLKSKENLYNKLNSIASLILTLTAVGSFFLTLIASFYVCALIYKFLIIFNMSKNLLTVLSTLGIILFDIGIITIEYKFIMPKIFDKLFDKVSNYVNNLKKFDKLKTLEEQKMNTDQKLKEKSLLLENIQAKYKECTKSLEFKEELVRFLEGDIKNKILTLSYYKNEDQNNNRTIEKSNNNKTKKLVP